MTNADVDVFAAKRDEVAAELEVALSELPQARAAVEALKSESLQASRRLNAIISRVTAAQRPVGECAPALLAVVNDARKVVDEVDGRLSLAKQTLANLLWVIECRQADLEQIDRIVNPQPIGRREVVRRARIEPEFVETIEFRTGRSGEAA